MEGVATPATPSYRVRSGGYRFFFSRWLRAEPAADLDAFDVRPSRSTLEAAFAAFEPVTFFANFTTSVPGPECKGPGPLPERAIRRNRGVPPENCFERSPT